MTSLFENFGSARNLFGSAWPFEQSARQFTGSTYSEPELTTDYDEELQRALAASSYHYESVEIKKVEARERLLQVVHNHGAWISPVQEDGNCQFRALAMSLYGSEQHHERIRAQVVRRMRVAQNHYAQFVHSEPFSDYLERMARDGEWGDHVTLQAASAVFGRRIQVFTDVPGAESIMVNPAQPRYGFSLGIGKRPSWSMPKPLCIAFTTELHYDAAFVGPPEEHKASL